VLAVGRNFASHLHGRPAPTEPGLFAKLPNAIVGPGDPIVLPPDSADVHFEGELVLVVGRTARRVDEADARGCILGVTAGNDVSERGWQKNDLQWLRAKGSDTFGPLGPAILVRPDLGDLLIETRVNGVTVQSERSSDLIFPLERILSFASRYITLLPGDVIYTGTPGSTSALAAGDRVEVDVEGVGTLANPVVATPGS
jgi:2-keto-4-pentenoate hydratase/2-oxohepta-3-ene-1,7-dioic acid hydratase in catechol pathway